MAEDNTPAASGGTEPVAIPLLPPDWDKQAVAKIYDTVEQVRIKSSGPAIVASRAIVFGLIGMVLATIAMIVFLIGLVRLLNIAIPEDIWLVYLILGALFSGIGMLLWSKRPRGAAS